MNNFQDKQEILNNLLDILENIKKNSRKRKVLVDKFIDLVLNASDIKIEQLDKKVQDDLISLATDFFYYQSNPLVRFLSPGTFGDKKLLHEIDKFMNALNISD